MSEVSESFVRAFAPGTHQYSPAPRLGSRRHDSLQHRSIIVDVPTPELDEAPATRSYVLIGDLAGRDPGSDDPSGDFRSYVLAHADRLQDQVVIALSNPDDVQRLTSIWADWPRCSIEWVSLTPGDSPSAAHDYFSTAGHPSAPAVFTRDIQLLRRSLPAGAPTIITVPARPLGEFLEQIAQQGPIALLAVEATSEWSKLIAEVCESTVPFEQCSLAVASADPSCDGALRKRGYLRSGRAWGAAGTSTLYRLPSGIGSRLSSARQEATVAVGRVAARLKSAVPDRADLHGARARAKVAFHPRYRRDEVLDPDHGVPRPPVSAIDVDCLARRYEAGEKRPFSVTISDEQSVLEVAAECYDRHGVWPISFNYPRPWQHYADPPVEALSPIVPGFPYSFVDHDEYMRCYNSASLGITHRKAGWDCFRHVEILASGSVPLMIDAADIPRYSMIHYPKGALALVADQALNHGGVPDDTTRAEFQRYFQEQLTTRAMAEYMLTVTGCTEAESVFFVDEQHPGISDYQSTLALIGLKEIYGAACRPLYPAPWIYDDYEGEISHLYGRGFGYTRVLPADARSAAESACLASNAPTTASDSEADLIVVGSVSRNLAHARELLTEHSPARTIWIHGEDTPPLIDDARMLRESGARVLVRSIGSR